MNPDTPSHYSPIISSQSEVTDWLENVPKGMTFVHGKAGSGKTHIIKRIERTVAGCQVLTPTNLAANLYRRARTLHSYFYGALDNLDEGYQNPDNLTYARVERLAPLLSGLSLLVFDEVSMIRSDQMEMIHRICSMALDCDLPFGGIPVVLVGDLFQLPPIVSDEAVGEFLRHEYGGIYFYDSHVVRNNIEDLRLFELGHSYRQSDDPDFARLLDLLREPLLPSHKIDVINQLNSRVTSSLPDDAVYIAPSNQEVNRINLDKLGSLPGPLLTNEAHYKIRRRDSGGYVSLTHSTLDSVLAGETEPLVVPSAYDSLLTFKIGARVLMTKNSRRAGFCNGDFGTVTDFDGRRFTIRLDRGITVMCPDPNDRYALNLLNDYRYEMKYEQAQHRLVRITPFVQSTHQYPLKPAYAFTIHKSQGQTYSKVILDLTSHIFAPGQLYVALSRARTLDSLYLTHPLTYSDIIVDASIFRFLDIIRRANGASPAAPELSPSPEPVTCEDPAAIRCDNFISFTLIHESDPGVRDFICHTLRAYRTVASSGHYDMALSELMKVVRLVTSTYTTDRYDELISVVTDSGPTAPECNYALNAIFEIYTDVVGGPRRGYSSDHYDMPYTVA